MAREIIRVGDFKGDHLHADDMYDGGQKLNRMMADIYGRLSHTISAGEERFSAGATSEARIDLALTQTLLELALYLEIPAFMLPFDITQLNQANLVALHAASGRLTREGGDPTLYDVRAYGAGGGTPVHDTASFSVAAAGAGVTGGEVYAPAGTYGLRLTQSQTSGGVHVLAGCTLRGDGYNTLIQLDPTSYTADGGWFAFVMETNTTIAHLRIDGQKNAVPIAGASKQVYAVTTVVGTQNVTFDALWIQDIYGLNAESFGILSYGSYNVIRDCKTWNIVGSGISVSGNIALTGDWTLGPDMGYGTRVENCSSWNNVWQGVTFYGVHDSTLVGGRFFGNQHAGINCEWCFKVDLWDAQVTGNTVTGLSTNGKASLRAHGLALYSNNTNLSSQHAEIELGSGAWYAGSPPPNGGAGTIEILNCSVIPSPGMAHLWYNRVNTVNVGFSVPDSIILRQSDAATWVIAGFGIIGIGQYPANLQMYGTQDMRVVAVGKPNQMLLSGCTSAAYAGTGNQSSDAVTITGTAQFQNATTPYVFKAGRTYRLRARLRQEDVNNTWQLNVKDASNTTYFYFRYNSTIAADIAAGVWFVQDRVFQVTVDCQLQLIQTNVSASTKISVDYIQVTELADVTGISAMPDTPAQSADRGDANVTLVAGTDAEIQRFDSALGANRTVTLNTLPIYDRARFRIVRTGLGAFTLNVGGLKTIPSATAAYVDVQYNATASAWQLTGYGLL